MAGSIQFTTWSLVVERGIQVACYCFILENTHPSHLEKIHIYIYIYKFERNGVPKLGIINEFQSSSPQHDPFSYFSIPEARTSPLNTESTTLTHSHHFHPPTIWRWILIGMWATLKRSRSVFWQEMWPWSPGSSFFEKTTKVRQNLQLGGGVSQFFESRSFNRWSNLMIFQVSGK